MKILIHSDSMVAEGCVNSIERNSKTVWSNLVVFLERIRKSMFSNALKRNDDVVPDDKLNRERRELGGRDV